LRQILTFLNAEERIIRHELMKVRA